MLPFLVWCEYSPPVVIVCVKIEYRSVDIGEGIVRVGNRVKRRRIKRLEGVRGMCGGDYR
jgi:hypothetical protein